MSGTPLPALQIDAVTVRFAGILALDGVSFSVQPASIHALIGPNGAGKSTCFNVISGFYPPVSGRVLLGDQPLTGRRPHERAALGIGRAFQHTSISPHQSVLTNLMLGRHHLIRAGAVSTGLDLPRARREQRRHEGRVREIAAFLGIDHLLDRPAGSLPYGDLKRADIARALATEPSVLLLDEPVAGMNAEETAAIAVAVQEIRRDLGIAILLVEHDIRMVMEIADRVTVLDFGRRIADGTPEQVQNEPDVLRAYLGSAGAPDGEWRG